MKRVLRVVAALAFAALAVVPAKADNYSEAAAYHHRGVETPLMKRYHIDQERRSLEFPEIPGCELLKCDFHIHTIYSDGRVTPSIRVEEAFYEGLDAIAITDHIEVPAREDVVTDNKNRAYELAKDYAEWLDVILIPGTEVTRDYPQGHFNAIFIKDANVFADLVNKDDPRDGSNIDLALAEAKRQGGFVFWNHPYFQDPEDLARWKPAQEELYQKGLIDGVEVINRDRYYPIVLKWALDKNLTVMGNTDLHTTCRIDPGCYRPMTLVLANERTSESIQEALEARKTVAFSQNYLYGSQQNIEPIFNACIETKVVNSNEKSMIVEFFNKSGLPFEFEIVDFGELKPTEYDRCLINAYGRYPLIINCNDLEKGKEYSIRVKVLNLQIGYNTPLEHTFTFKL